MPDALEEGMTRTPIQFASAIPGPLYAVMISSMERFDIVSAIENAMKLIESLPEGKS